MRGRSTSHVAIVMNDVHHAARDHDGTSRSRRPALQRHAGARRLGAETGAGTPINTENTWGRMEAECRRVYRITPPVDQDWRRGWPSCSDSGPPPLWDGNADGVWVRHPARGLPGGVQGISMGETDQRL